MMSLSDDKHADIIDAFNTASRYLDNILNINIVFFWQYGMSNIEFTCWTSFAPVFSFTYCGVLIFALSPFYILIYMF